MLKGALIFCSAGLLASSNWTIGFAYGNTVRQKDTIDNERSNARVQNFGLLEVDLFNKNGLGLVYMTNTNKSKLEVTTIGGVSSNKGTYSFNGYFLGCQKKFTGGVNGRLLVGLSDQKIDGSLVKKSSSKFAYGVSGAYNLRFSGKIDGFAELGYLGQSKAEYQAGYFYEASGFYWKVGVKMPI